MNRPDTLQGNLRNTLRAAQPNRRAAMLWRFSFLAWQRQSLLYNLAALFLLLFFALLLTFLPPLFSFQRHPWLVFLFAFGLLFIFTRLRSWLETVFDAAIKRSAYQKNLSRYRQAIREISDPDTLLQYITQAAQALLGAGQVSLWIYRKEEKVLGLAHPVEAHRVDLPVDIEFNALQRTNRRTELPESALRRGLLHAGVDAIAVMRLGEEFVGIIGLGGEAQAELSSRESTRLLQALANESALAVKNACLLADQEKTLRKLQLAYRASIDAQDEERRHLAAELHDDILGRLMTTALTLRSSQKRLASRPAEVSAWLKALEEETRYIQNRLREITQGLHPSVLSDLGLISALRAYLDTLSKQALSSSAPHTIVLTVQGFGSNRLNNKRLEKDAYNIVRQALDNAIQHARAGQVFIHLRWGDKTLSLTVQDTGQGLSEKANVLMGKNGHLGMLSMNERAQAWGGRLIVEGEKEQGVTVRAQLPVEKPSPTPTQLQIFTHYLKTDR